MSSRMRATLQFLVALVLLSGLGWLVYLGATFVGRGVASLKSDVAVAIVAASASVTISIISLVIAKRLEVQASITQELRAKKHQSMKTLLGWFTGYCLLNGLAKNQ